MNLSPQQKTILTAVGSTFLMAALLVSDVARPELGVHWELDEVIQSLLWTFLGVFAFFCILYAIFRHAEKTLTLTILLTFIFFSFKDIVIHMSVPLALLTQVGLAGAALFLTLRFPGFCRGAFSVSIITMLICTYFYSAQIAKFLWFDRYHLSGMPLRQALLDKKDVPEAYTDSTKYPDIYFIIFDAYAANQTLKQLFDFDNTPFLNELQKRGFYQAADSKSYYMQTMLSVSSTLNANYMQEDIVLPNDKSADRLPVIDYFLHPRVPRFLKDIGYDLAWFSTGYAQDYSFNPDVRDIRASTLKVEIASYLLVRTPLHQILTYIFGTERTFLNPYMDHYQELRDVAGKTTARVLEKTDRPKFTFVHFLLPHTPFVCDGEGNFAGYRNIAPFHYGGRIFNFYDHLYEGGAKGFYKKGYIENVKCANTYAIRIADDIIAHRSGRPVVIFMMADHGSRLKQYFNGATDPDEAFRIFNATYFSDGDYSGFTQDIGPVNMMRMMLNKYFGLKLEKLEDHQWFSAWFRPYKLEEMTAKIKD